MDRSGVHPRQETGTMTTYRTFPSIRAARDYRYQNGRGE